MWDHLRVEGGSWVTPSTEGPTFGFDSARDLVVHEFKPHIRLYADSMEPAWDSLSLSLSLCLSVKQNLKKEW